MKVQKSVGLVIKKGSLREFGCVWYNDDTD